MRWIIFFFWNLAIVVPFHGNGKGLGGDEVDNGLGEPAAQVGVHDLGDERASGMIGMRLNERAGNGHIHSDDAGLTLVARPVLLRGH